MVSPGGMQSHMVSPGTGGVQPGGAVRAGFAGAEAAEAEAAEAEAAEAEAAGVATRTPLPQA